MVKYFLVFFFFILFLYLISGSDPYNGDIGVLEVSDVIENVDEQLKLLQHYEDSSDIKAVLLRIDSPGGMVAPTQELYRALRQVGEKKPVVASLGATAASGGYYLACAAQHILANPGTITGSIGVLMPHFDASELIEFLKVRPGVIKSGRFKDLNMPYRPMRPDEQSHLQGIVNALHTQFKQAVKLGRDLNDEQLNAIADGRIFTGEDALKLGLIDELGGLRDAIRIAGEMVGIKGTPTIVYPPKKSFFDQLLEAKSQRAKSYILNFAFKPLFLAY